MVGLTIAGGGHAAGITELFVPEAGGVGAVEWQAATDADATPDGVTLLAVRVSGRSEAQGLIVGAWHAEVAGPTVLWHDGDPTALPGFLPGFVDGTTGSITLPAFVGWDDVGWAVFSGDVTSLALQLGATLASSDTRSALGPAGLLAGVTVGPADASAWVPTAGELSELGADASAWRVAVIEGSGVFRPEGEAGWLGGGVAPSGAVVGDGYWFDATPAAINGPAYFVHYPEPATVSIVLIGLLPGLGRRSGVGVRVVSRADAAYSR